MISKRTVFIIFLAASGAKADYFPVYKCVAVKTNILSLYNISMDFPLFDRFTTEFSYRHYGGSAFWTLPETRTMRLNVKCHFAMDIKQEYDPSFFLQGGSSHMYQGISFYKDVSNSSYTEQEYDVYCLTVGMGLRFRRFSAWLAYEKPYYTVTNYSRYHGSTGKMYPDEGTMISGGFALTLFNVNPLKKTD